MPTKLSLGLHPSYIFFLRLLGWIYDANFQRNDFAGVYATVMMRTNLALSHPLHSAALRCGVLALSCPELLYLAKQCYLLWLKWQY